MASLLTDDNTVDKATSCRLRYQQTEVEVRLAKFLTSLNTFYITYRIFYVLILLTYDILYYLCVVLHRD